MSAIPWFSFLGGGGGGGGGAAVLKLGCTANFDLLFLVMGFVSLVDEIQVTAGSKCWEGYSYQAHGNLAQCRKKNQFNLIFLAGFFYDCNLDFTCISKLSISFPHMTSIMRIWRKYLSGFVARGSRSSKLGFPRLRRDSGFSRKIGMVGHSEYGH